MIIKILNINFGRGYVYSIQYHIVWCVKYRRKVLNWWYWKKLINFQRARKRIWILKKQKVAFEIEIDTLKNASNELSSKICPYLKENCENLKDKEADDYFSSKISDKTEAIEDLKKR